MLCVRFVFDHESGVHLCGFQSCPARRLGEGTRPHMHIPDEAGGGGYIAYVSRQSGSVYCMCV